MLSPADADLVRRDTALPGLATLLDPGAFLATLRQAMPAVNADAVSITYVRYKPGTSCLVGYRIHGDAPCDAAGAALRMSAVDKLAPERGGPDRVVLAERGLVISRFPHDDGLPALARLSESSGRFLERVLPHEPQLWDAAVQTIRYKPDRRYVAKLAIGGEPRAVLKVYSESGFDAARDNARAFQSESVVRCPKRLGRSNRHRVVVMDWLPGRLLFECMAEPDFEPAIVERVGAALCALHSQAAAVPRSRTRADEAASLPPLAEWLAFVAPSVADRARRLARQLAARFAGLFVADTPLHGDFYSKQVLVDGDAIGIIDFDEAFRGDPAHDLGLFLAHLERDANRGLVPRPRVATIRNVLLTGYGPANALNRVDLYTAAGLLRLAPHPFRNRESGWPDATAALLDRAIELSREEGSDE